MESDYSGRRSVLSHMLECVRCGYEVGEIASERAGFICPECGTTDRPEETITRRDMFRAVVSMCWPVWVAAGVFVALIVGVTLTGPWDGPVGEVAWRPVAIILAVSACLVGVGSLAFPVAGVYRLKFDRRWNRHGVLLTRLALAAMLGNLVVAGILFLVAASCVA